mgnify:CR=1 FL=1
MAVQTLPPVRFAIGAPLLALSLLTLPLLTLAACGKAEQAPPPPAAEAAETPAPAPAVVSVADSLTPQDVVLRGLECRRSLISARGVSDRLPADLVEKLAATPDVGFGQLIMAGSRMDLTMDDNKKAQDAARRAPEHNETVTPDYVKYVDDCTAIMTRAASVVAEKTS